MYFFNLAELEKTFSIGRWFSTNKRALTRFHREDYYGSPEETLASAIRNRMMTLSGHPVTGDVYGLLNLRTLGLYFSPVNFYYGYDKQGNFSHFLAEVSNTPWNERHQYAHYIGDGNLTPVQKKEFKVSPFNPVDQTYNWSITEPGEGVTVTIAVDDKRGRVFEAMLELERKPLTRRSLRRELIRRPIMTASVVGAIYYQALKIFLKKIPYIPYDRKEAA